MRVLYWTEVFSPYTGGTEVAGETLLRGLRERGYRFIVVTSHGPLDLPDEDLFDGIPVHRLPFLAASAERDPAQVIEVRRRATALKRSFAPDLVHVHAVGPSLFFHLQSAKASPAPWLFTPHTPLADERAGKDTILGEAFRAADWIACVSEAHRRSIEAIAPETIPRLSVIYWGLEPPAIEPPPLPFDPPRLLCLGRHVRDKGFDVALEAFALLAGRFPDLRLILVGDGPERPALQQRAAELGVPDRVDFPGRVPEIQPWLGSATLVLMPSRWEETFGLVALEAALMGRPVVATRVGALPEVVRHGITGLVVEKEDGAAMARAIESLLEQPEATRRMSRATRERALDTFSLRRCIDRYEELYRRLARRESNASGTRT